MALQNLPSELILMIIRGLDTPRDVLHLLSVSRALHSAIGDAEVAKKDAEYQQRFAGRLQNPNLRLSEPFLHWVVAHGASLDRIEAIVRACLTTPSASSSSPSYWYVHGLWNGAWPSTLLAAIMADRLDVVELLLRLLQSAGGTTYDFINGFKRGEDPLWSACDLRREAIAHFLLDRGARISEEHLLSAAFQRLPRVLQRLLSAANDPDGVFWMPSSYVRALGAAARSPDHGELGANREIIDMVIAAASPEFHVLHGDRDLWEIFTETYARRGCYQNALYLWDIYEREHVRNQQPSSAGVNGCQLPHNLALAAIKKKREQKKITESESESEPWTAEDELLLAALARTQSDGSSESNDNGIIEYLREAGHPVSARHYAVAVERGNIPVRDAILARGIDVNEKSAQNQTTG